MDTHKDIKIFMVLLGLALLLIALRWLHLGSMPTIIFGGLIGLLEMALVVYYFIHLADHRRIVHVLLLMTFIFFASLIFWVIWDYQDSIRHDVEHSWDKEAP
jgi:caa(3)-type oxidase subunit IV